MDKRFLIVPIGTLSLAFGATGAQAALVGDSGQSGTQNFVTNQNSDLSDNTDGITTDDTTSTAANNSLSAAGSAQVIGQSSGAIVGAPLQSSAQSLATDQDVSGSGENDSGTIVGSAQIIFAGVGGAIVGSPHQSSAQTAHTGQATDGGGTNSAFTGIGSAQLVLSVAGAIVGSPAQSNAQASGIAQGITESSDGSDYTATITQTDSNSALVLLGSVQDVGLPGSVIVGSPGQANGQNAAVGQNIDSDVTGDFLIGTFDQTGTNSDAEGAGNAQIIF